MMNLMSEGLERRERVIDGLQAGASPAAQMAAYKGIGLRHAELADSLQVTASTIYKWGSGTRSPEVRQAERLDDFRGLLRILIVGQELPFEEAAQWLRTPSPVRGLESPLSDFKHHPSRIIICAALMFDTAQHLYPPPLQHPVKTDG